jgi:hypothetical protein
VIDNEIARIELEIVPRITKERSINFLPLIQSRRGKVANESIEVRELFFSFSLLLLLKPTISLLELHELSLCISQSV